MFRCHSLTWQKDLARIIVSGLPFRARRKLTLPSTLPDIRVVTQEIFMGECTLCAHLLPSLGRNRARRRETLHAMRFTDIICLPFVGRWKEGSTHRGSATPSSPRIRHPGTCSNFTRLHPVKSSYTRAQTHLFFQIISQWCGLLWLLSWPSAPRSRHGIVDTCL